MPTNSEKHVALRSIDSTPIEKNPQGFVATARREFKKLEATYRSQKYAIIEKCAVAVEFAKRNRDFRKFVQGSEFWLQSREKPATSQSAKWCTLLILDPQSAQERATAGRYAAIIESLLGQGVEAKAVAAELKARGGIDKVYSEAVRKTANSASTNGVPDEEGEPEGDEEADGAADTAESTDDDHLRAQWSRRNRNKTVTRNGYKWLKVLVSGRPGTFKKVVVKEVRDIAP